MKIKTLRAWFTFTLALPLFLTACAEAPPSTGEVQTNTLAQVSDGAHENGTEGFYFLPPLTKQPAYNGVFDPNVAVGVQIDELDPTTGSVVQVLASYSHDDVPETLRVGTDSYSVQWRTNDFTLNDSAIYRIRVLANGIEIGFADVDVVSKGNELRNVNTNEYIALKDGRVLQIRFRIETGALDEDSDGISDGDDNCPSTPNPSQVDTDDDGDGDACDTDDDNDGVSDGEDSAPGDPTSCRDIDTDGCDDCSSTTDDPNNDGQDTDGDGTCDVGDLCETDPQKTQPGICGCGLPDTEFDGIDADGDGHTLPGSCVGSADDCNDADPDVFPGALDLCDGTDTNCDGTADNDFASSTTTCGVGTCAATGVTSCVAGGVSDSCKAGAPASSDFICNGLDEDCDGSTDEDFSPTNTSCGVGACQSIGTSACVRGEVVNVCTEGSPAPNDSTCNGIDDDCDGASDEDFTPLKVSCGEGNCTRTGTALCVNGSLREQCTPAAPEGVLTSTAHRITDGAGNESSPSLGADTHSEIVVYTRRDLEPDGTTAPGAIWYQRIESDGTPMLDTQGNPLAVQVSIPLVDEESGVTLVTDDQLNDISGDRIVYTAFKSQISNQGWIVLYDIPSGTTTKISASALVREARIHGDWVVWGEGQGGATEVKVRNLNWSTSSSVTLAGPTPPATNVEISERYIVWDVYDEGQYDVRAYDLDTGFNHVITQDPSLMERRPHSSGNWIVWESIDNASATIQILAVNLATGERQTVVDSGGLNFSPTVDGNIVAFESNDSGDYEIYVHRLSEGDTFLLTDDTADQYLNNVFGDKVSYVHDSEGKRDVWISHFQIEPDPTCSP